MERKLYSSDYFYDPTFPLKVIERDPELPYPLHSHDFFELVVIISGTGEHVTATNAFSLAPGNVFIITPGQSHGYAAVRDLRLYNIMFDLAVLGDAASDIAAMPGFHAMCRLEPSSRDDPGESSLMMIPPEHVVKITTTVEAMLRESDSMEQGNGSRTLARSLLQQLMVELFRMYADFPRKDNRTILRLASVLSYIEAHLGQQISTQELKDVAGMSASTLNRVFKRATGCPPVDYMIKRRISRACTLLESSGMDITRIAQYCGFDDTNYFSRLFRKTMGCNAQQYRKTCSRFFQV